MKTIKQAIIKYFPLIAVYILLLSFAFYGIYFRQRKIYNEYNDLTGTVISYSVSRNGDYIVKVRLSKGDIGDVNNGNSIVKVGDRWRNRINYNPIFGMSGTAYFITPSEGRGLLEGLTMLCLFIVPLLVFGIYLFCNLCKVWAQKVDEKDRIEKQIKSDLEYIYKIL